MLLNEQCVLHEKAPCASVLAVNRLMLYVEHCEVCVCVVETESVQCVWLKLKVCSVCVGVALSVKGE